MGGRRMATNEENDYDPEPMQFQQEPKLRLLLVGRSGAGKSATGNSILGQDFFPSLLSATPVTTACAVGTCRWGHRLVEVLDTPDLCSFDIFDTDPRWLERGRCILLSAPGPHVLLLVSQMGRFTNSDQQAVRALKAMFGDHVVARTILLFTRKEDLEGGSVQEYVHGSNNHTLHQLVAECGDRVCAFDNRAQGHWREAQVAELMAMVEQLLSEQGGGPYTEGSFLLAQTSGFNSPEERLHWVSANLAVLMDQHQRPRGLLSRLWACITEPANRRWVFLCVLVKGTILFYLLYFRDTVLLGRT